MIEVMRMDVEIKGSTWTELATVPVSDHLVACLVSPLPTTMRFVNLDDVNRWVSIYEAMEVARQNLAEREFSLASILGQRIFIFLTGDAFDATRLLLVDKIRSLELTGRPVALPLNRDSLLVTGSDDVEGLRMMADLAEKKQDEPRPVCPIPHVLVDDSWEPWLPPADQPHYARFRTLELRYLYGEYTEQKALLEQRHQKTGEDVFIATYSVIECAWHAAELGDVVQRHHFLVAEGRLHRALQPRSGTDGLRVWDRLQSVAGHLMQAWTAIHRVGSSATFPRHSRLSSPAPDSTKSKA